MQLLERDAQLEQIAELVAAAPESGGRVVLVRGEAGIGKTALVRAAADAVRADAHVLIGRSDDLATPQPLEPFWDMARGEPGLLAPLDAGARLAVFTALLDLLERRLRPTLMIIEDTHWADGATLDAIKYLGRRIRDTNGVLLLTFRDGEPGAGAAMRSALGDLEAGDVARIRLGPLSRAAVSELMAETPGDIDEIVAVTGGNPFYVTELIGTSSGSVPASVLDSLIGRLSKLTERARQLAEVMSVVPGETERRLAEKLGLGDPVLFDQLTSSRLALVTDGGIAFRHELARRAVEASLTPSRRVELNGAVMAALEDDTDVARLVHHAREAGDAGGIVRYAPTAAARASQMGSHREAMAHYQLLEPYLESFGLEERLRILTAWASEAELLDEIDKAADLVESALDIAGQLEDPALLADALIKSVDVEWNRGDGSAAEAAADRALALLADTDDERRYAFALSRRSQLAMLKNEYSSAAAFADRAHRMAAKIGDPHTAAHSLINKGQTMVHDDFEGGLAVINRGRAIAAEHGIGLEEARAATNTAWLLVATMRLERAGPAVAEAVAVCFRNEVAGMEGYARSVGTYYSELVGDWGAGEDVARDLLSAEIPSVPTNIQAAASLGAILARRGRSEADEVLAEAWRSAINTGEPQRYLRVGSVIAERHYLSGVEASMVDEVATATASARASSWLQAFPLYWLWRSGAIPSPGTSIDPFQACFAGDVEIAARWWREAGSPYYEADALAQGDGDQQIDALRIFQSLGANAAAHKVRYSLHEAGVHIPRGLGAATRRNPAGLTARQAEVLELLGEGLTNAAIAERLFLSTRTVEHHVAGVFSKLEVENRDEAVIAAIERGLLAIKNG